MDAGDLTEAVQTARRGLKRDVEILCRALDKGALYLPLAKALRAQPGTHSAEGAESVSLHALGSGEGRVFGAAFTREGFLSECGQVMRWTTDGGPLQFARVTALEAFRLQSSLLREGRIGGVAINPLQTQEIILLPEEVEKLSRGDSFPMPRYIGNLPVQKDERFIDAGPAAPSPAVTSALDALIGGDILAYSLRRVLNPDRDIEPHLLVRITTRASSDRHPELAARIQRAVQGKVPPPGYVDLFFQAPAA